MIERNKYGKAIVKATDNGLNGSGVVSFIPDDGYNAPHWAVFVTVPYQPSKWEYLHADSEEEAIAEAQEIVEYKLSICTFV